jgi:hypothetical protein
MTCFPVRHRTQLASDDGITARSQRDGKQSRMADANHGAGVRPSGARSVM